MKKKIKFLAFAFVLSITSFTATAADAVTTEPDPKERIEQLETRVHEIWKMDFTEMEKADKMAIRQELKDIKKELKTTGLDSKVSISIGAIIIILLVIILIS